MGKRAERNLKGEFAYPLRQVWKIIQKATSSASAASSASILGRLCPDLLQLLLVGLLHSSNLVSEPGYMDLAHMRLGSNTLKRWNANCMAVHGSHLHFSIFGIARLGRCEPNRRVTVRDGIILVGRLQEWVMETSVSIIASVAPIPTASV